MRFPIILLSKLCFERLSESTVSRRCYKSFKRLSRKHIISDIHVDLKCHFAIKQLKVKQGKGPVRRLDFCRSIFIKLAANTITYKYKCHQEQFMEIFDFQVYLGLRVLSRYSKYIYMERLQTTDKNGHETNLFLHYL